MAQTKIKHSTSRFNRPMPKKDPNKPRNMYFDNPLVESLLRQYVKGGCTDIVLRDSIMSHAGELIRQVIRTHGLYNIYGGGEDSSFNDLFQIAWIQIEKTLYKFDYSEIFTMVHESLNGNKLKYKIRGMIKYEDDSQIIAKITRNDEYVIGGRKKSYDVDDVVKLLKSEIVSRRHDHKKVFNMWSQVAKTVVLAHIKKETRDKKNYTNYSSYLKYKPNDPNYKLERFFSEAENLCQYDEEDMVILKALKSISNSDLENASNGLISKLMNETQLSRQKITSFFKKVRAYHGEFSDSPSNFEQNYIGNPGGSTRKYNLDSEEDW